MQPYQNYSMMQMQQPSYQNPYSQNLYGQSPYDRFQQQSNLSGRMVANENEIMANEVSMNGNASYFPVADGSQIIVKKWNANGLITTQVFRLDTPLENAEVDNLPQSNIKSLETAFRSLREDIFKELEEIKLNISPTTTRKTKKEVTENE